MFSFGIILWEVMARRQPFHHIGGPAYRIMWAVHQGKRPHLIQACPEVLECLMRRCWEKDAVLRPSMTVVVKILSTIQPLFPGSDEQLRYPSNSSPEALGLGYGAEPPDGSELGDQWGGGGEAMARPVGAGVAYHQPLNMEPIEERTEEGAFITERRRSVPASPQPGVGRQRPNSLLPPSAASLEENPYQVPRLPTVPYRLSPTGATAPYRPSPTSIPEEPLIPAVGLPAPSVTGLPSPTAAALALRLGGDERNKRHSADLSQLDRGGGRTPGAAPPAGAPGETVHLTHEQKKALGELERGQSAAVWGV